MARRAVVLREGALGPEHPEMAADLAALAARLDGQGQYAEAEALYQRALALKEQLLGRKHLDVALTAHNLAML